MMPFLLASISLFKAMENYWSVLIKYNPVELVVSSISKNTVVEITNTRGWLCQYPPQSPPSLSPHVREAGKLRPAFPRCLAARRGHVLMQVSMHHVYETGCGSEQHEKKWLLISTRVPCSFVTAIWSF